MIVIGDVHGKVDAYYKKIQKHKETIQVGDFGFAKQHQWHLENVKGKHYINFGNHDDTTFVNERHSLRDYGMYNSEIMTVRGAFSIDKQYRTEGVSWWANEELNYTQMEAAVEYYAQSKPSIMITHDCPSSVRKELFGINDEDNKTLTTQGLQAMFEIHQPKLWLFGHHHESKNEVINGTRFICLAELETFKI